MKKIFGIILLTIVVFPANAQTEKHTKEKLVADIIEYYKMKKNIAISGVNSDDFEGKNYNNFKIEFTNNSQIMDFSYDYQYEYNSLMTDVKDSYVVRNKMVIDLSQIENISLKTVNTLNKEKHFFVLNFKAKPNTTITKFVSEKDQELPEIPEKVTEVAIPLSTNCCAKEDVDIINNKILQIFNKLRE